MSNELSTEPFILAVETATRTGSVAVARGENVLAARSGDPSKSHSTDLIENIDAVLREARVELPAIDLFAAAIGPGSFTGLRIGLATVKSLAMSLGRKCVGVPTLAALAYAAGVSQKVIALLPAGRGEVFAQMFTVHDHTVEPLDAPTHIRPAALLAKYGSDRQLVWTGEGAQAQLELLRSAAAEKGIEVQVTGKPNPNGWRVIVETPRLAEAVAALAFREWQGGKTTGAADLRANYVRLSDAEIKGHV